jgi:hypothetical protein
MRSVIVILALAASHFWQEGKQVAESIVPCPDDSTLLFPVAALESRADWYGRQLRAMNEGPLCSYAKKGEEMYRLVWIPTFDPAFVARVHKDSAGYWIVAKLLDGAGGYDPGALQVDKTIGITPDEWDRLKMLLDGASFWDLPVEDTRPGLDGAQWIMEGVIDREYHAVDRWVPEHGSSYRRLCEWLLQRTGLVSRDLVAGY